MVWEVEEDSIDVLFDRTAITKRGCWEFLGYKDKNGYGQITYKSKSYLAHRLAYMICVGEITKGYYVLHKCDNPPCINPEHLFLGTQTDNIKDRHLKGRDAVGETANKSKLTGESIVNIRKLLADGYSTREVSSLYNVDPNAIRCIGKRITWKHIP